MSTWLSFAITSIFLDDGTDLKIEVPLVSRQHAKLTVNYSEMFIQD